MGTKLNLSTTNHPQLDDQTEMTIQTMKDMFRACILEDEGSWNPYLLLNELANKDSYRTGIGVAPYEELYRRKCCTSLC